MSKGLELLEKIKKEQYVDGRLPLIDRVRFELIEKSLKSFEISKELIAKIKELCQKYETEPFDFGFKTILQLILEKEKELYD